MRDNGIGIPEKHHDAVFRIFKRLHGRDKFGGGTGAGLTIVKKIVERHPRQNLARVVRRPRDDVLLHVARRRCPCLKLSTSRSSWWRTAPRTTRPPRAPSAARGSRTRSSAAPTVKRRSTTSTGGGASPIRRRPPGRASSCSTSTCRARTGARCCRAVKADPNLKQIPVIVLTTSKDDRDVEACYRAGASSYIQKPVDLEGFMKAIERLNDYWFEVVILPKVQE